MPPHVKSELCPGCQKLRPHVGPWRVPGQPPTRLCGPCKVSTTLRRPDFAARLAKSLGIPESAVTIHPVDDENTRLSVAVVNARGGQA